MADDAAPTVPPIRKTNMTTKATPQQRRYINHLMSEVVSMGIDEDEQSLDEASSQLTPSQKILWLELRGEEDWLVTPQAVVELEGLGYTSLAEVRAASRLTAGAPSSAMLIAAVGLRSDRAKSLLEVTPDGMPLFSPGDDREWTKAVLGLPTDTLQGLLAAEVPQADLWMSVVSAHDPAMKRRIERFVEAGVPFIPWIVSGHSVEDLLEAAGEAGVAHPSRATIHKAVRSLDHAEVPEEEDEDE